MAMPIEDMEQTAEQADAPEPGRAVPTVTNGGSATALQPHNESQRPAKENERINQAEVGPANNGPASTVNSGQHHGKDEPKVSSGVPSSSTVGSAQEHASGALGRATEHGCQTDAVNFTEQMQRLRARLQSVVQGVREVAQSLDEPHSLIANVRDQLQHRNETSARRSTPIDTPSPAMYHSTASQRRSMPTSPYTSPLVAAAVAISPLISARGSRQSYHPTMIRQDFMSGHSATSMYASTEAVAIRATGSDAAGVPEHLAVRMAHSYSAASDGSSPPRTSMHSVSQTTSGDEAGAIGGGGSGGGGAGDSGTVRARVAAVERRARSVGGMPDLLPVSLPYTLAYHLPAVSENGPDSATLGSEGLGQTPSEVLEEADGENDASSQGVGEEGQPEGAASSGRRGGSGDGGRDEEAKALDPTSDRRGRSDGTDGIMNRTTGTYTSGGADALRGSVGRPSSTNTPMAHALSRSSSTASGSSAVVRPTSERGNALASTSTDDTTPGAQGAGGDPRLLAASTNAAAAAAYLREHPEMLKELWTLRARVRLQESELEALIKQLSTKNAQLDATQAAVQQKERELNAITRRMTGVLAKLQSFQAAHNLQHQHYQRQQTLLSSHTLASSVSSPASFPQLQPQQQQEPQQQGDGASGSGEDVRRAGLPGDPSWDSPQPAVTPTYPHTPTTASVTAAGVLGATTADAAPPARPAVRRLFAEEEANGSPENGNSVASDAALPAQGNVALYPPSLDGGMASSNDDRDQWSFAAGEPRFTSLDFPQPPSPSVWAGSSLLSHQPGGGTEQEASSEGGVRQALLYMPVEVPDAGSSLPDMRTERTNSRGGWFGGLAKILLQVAPSLICVALLLRDPAVRRGLAHLWGQFGGGNAGTGPNGPSRRRAGTLPPGRAAEIAAAARAAPLDVVPYAAVLGITGSVGEAFESRASAECKARWCAVVRPPSKTLLYY